MPRVVNWIGRMPDQSRRAFQSAKEQIMRKHLLAISAILAAMSAPIAAQAQSDTVGVRGGAVVVDENGGIAVDQRPAFREYVIRERVPNYSIPDRVIVGGVLPETGVTYYDVPQTFGATPFRYTVVNGRTVLVEPRTRRIVQVIE
jgi:non-ribosomal peptide synthetase component E (peptide arylation enzyme)